MMRFERLGVHDVDISLGELAIATLLRPLAAPDLLDLVTPEGKRQLMGVLQNVAGKRHGEIEVQTKIGRAVLTVQPLDCVDLLVDLALLRQTIQRLYRAGFDGGEAVYFEGLA